MGLVEQFGGGTKGWRTVALIFAIIALVVNTFSVLMVKEVPDENVTSSGENKNSGYGQFWNGIKAFV